MRRCFRQQFRSGVAEAALIEDEEVEPGEVRRDQRELFAQRSLRQAQRGADGEPVGFDVEEHEGAVVAPAGEIEASNEHVAPKSNYRQSSVATPRPQEGRSCPFRGVSTSTYMLPTIFIAALTHLKTLVLHEFSQQRQHNLEASNFGGQNEAR